MDIRSSILKNSGLITEATVSSRNVIVAELIKRGAVDKGDTESISELTQEVYTEMKKNPKLSIIQAVEKITDGSIGS